MAANVLHYHDRNPFYTAKTRPHLIIFSLANNTVNKLVVRSPIALRVLLVLVGKLNEQGYAAASLDELALSLRTPRTYVNKGILELARHKFIAKKKRGEYWINPQVFRSMLLEL